MNYSHHYNQLIKNANKRNTDVYTESHHIIPRCMGGSDEKTNLVNLTPEEHYVAHQLLIKIYPENRKLIYAAVMMCVSSKGARPKNKLYGWLRRKLSESRKLNTGINSSQLNTSWVFNNKLNIAKKINNADVELYIKSGWYPGRIFRHSCICVVCNTSFYSIKYRDTCSTECRVKNYPMYSVLKDRELEFLEKYKELNSIAAVRKYMKYAGSTDYFYQWAHAILKQDCSSMDRINDSESLGASSILADPTK